MRRVIACVLFSFLILEGGNAFSYTEEECIKCHGSESGENKSILRLSVDTYQNSVHGGMLTCEDCHTDVVDEDHESMDGYSNVNCSTCHEEINLHGRGSEEGVNPQCHACHSKHSILPKTDKNSWVHAENLENTCGACHPEQTGSGGFFSWMGSIQVRSHGKQNLNFGYQKGDCLGCHQGQGAHGEENMINDRNCHECHKPLDAKGSLLGSIHPVDKINGDIYNGILKIVYIALFVLICFGAFLYYIKIFSNKISNNQH